MNIRTLPAGADMSRFPYYIYFDYRFNNFKQGAA